MRDHLAACLEALAALFGATRHVLVLFGFLAFSRALVAGLCTGFANDVAERPMPRNDAGGCGTRVGTILAGLQCQHVLLFAFHQLMRAVGCARVAFALAVVARVRTVIEHVIVRLMVVVVFLRLLLSNGRVYRQRRCGRKSQSSKFTSSDHDGVSPIRLTVEWAFPAMKRGAHHTTSASFAANRTPRGWRPAEKCV